MKIPKPIKIFLGALVTIFLGAIGSAVWEKALSPLLSYLFSGITSTISSLSSSYSDSIYSRASDLFDTSSDSVRILFLFVVFCGLFFFALNSKKESRYVTFFHKAITDHFRGWVGIIYSGSILIVLLFMLSRQTIVERIQGYSVKQMEILRPYVGEEKYLHIRSDYLRMRSKRDFDIFSQKLYDTAKAVSVDVPKFTQNWQEHNPALNRTWRRMRGSDKGSHLD